MSDASKAKEEKKPSELRETIIVIIEALVIAFVFRSFFYQPFSIPTASLQPSMMIGDYFVASKFTWGYGRYSFSPVEVPIQGRIFGREPNRGDIAVFRPVPQKDDYVKRIVGLPGDTIQMKQGRLYINDVMVEREFIERSTDKDSFGTVLPVLVYKEILPNGVSHLIHEISDKSRMDNTSEYLVPEGHYFMMGDNRDRSQDSRFLSAVGYVPASNLIGKAEARFFSVEDNVPPWQIWQWPTKLRLDRMFQSVY